MLMDNRPRKSATHVNANAPTRRHPPADANLVRVTSGPFKGRTYERQPNGQLRRLFTEAELSKSRRYVKKTDSHGDEIVVKAE